MKNSFRSLLFVPGNRPERFAKALAAGADAICIDLEDAVPPTAKTEARASVLHYLGARGVGGGCAVGLRINGLRTHAGFADLAALAEGAVRPDFLMFPKCSDAAEAAILAEAFPEWPLWPIIESAAGLQNAMAIANSAGVAGMLFGAVDFAAESGGTLEWEALAYARGALANARAAATIELLDVPALDIHDLVALEQSTRRARALGFTGRACIHPAQIATVNQVFTPTEAEITHANRLIAALAEAQGQAATLDGKLIEKPVILAAQRTLARVRPQ